MLSSTVFLLQQSQGNKCLIPLPSSDFLLVLPIDKATKKPGIIYTEQPPLQSMDLEEQVENIQPPQGLN